MGEIDADRRPLWKRLGWMLVFWVGGVAVVGVVAMVIRGWLG